MKRLAIPLAAVLMIAVIAAALLCLQPASKASFTVSGDADDTRNAVYFLAEAVYNDERQMYRMDKSTLKIEAADAFGRSVYALGSRVYYNYGDCIAEVGRGPVLGEYNDMFRFVLTRDDVLYYPENDTESRMIDLDNYDRLDMKGGFPIFDENREDYYLITTEVLDGSDPVCIMSLNKDGEDHQVLITDDPPAYNNGRFHIYHDTLYVCGTVKLGEDAGIYAIDLNSFQTSAVCDGDALIRAAHERLFVRESDALVVYDLAGTELARYADVFADGTLVFVDSYEKAVYVINTAAKTAEKLDIS